MIVTRAKIDRKTTAGEPAVRLLLARHAVNAVPVGAGRLRAIQLTAAQHLTRGTILGVPLEYRAENLDGFRPVLPAIGGQCSLKQLRKLLHVAPDLALQSEQLVDQHRLVAALD